MNGLTLSKSGIELFILEGQALFAISDAISEKLNSSPDLTEVERAFWLERKETISNIACSDARILKEISEIAAQSEVKKQAQLN